MQLSLQQVMRAVERDDMTGICRACGSEQENVEPDAERYKCLACEANEVYGAARLLEELV